MPNSKKNSFPEAPSSLVPRSLLRRTFLYVSSFTRHRLESALVKTIFPCLILACAQVEEKKVVSKAADNLQELKSKCETQAHVLSCARYGYLTKDLNYTREACRLGDENSCFNVREIENRAPNQNFSIITNNQNQIFGCYVNHSIDLDNGEGKKADKEVNLLFTINPLGNISSLTVLGEKLSPKFKECVVNSFGSKKFTPLPHDQSIRFNFLMPAITRDRRVKQQGSGLLD